MWIGSAPVTGGAGLIMIGAARRHSNSGHLAAQDCPPVAVQPGDTWNFQAWYRDIGNTNNFTDAVAVTFE